MGSGTKGLTGSPMSHTLKALRKTLRQQRRALSPATQLQHTRAATHHFLRTPFLQRPKTIAVFISADGELPTQPLIEQLWHRGHRVYLPVLEHALPHPMLFAPYTPNTPLKPNRYGIPEPIGKAYLTGCQLDLVITPLVAFDACGHRLGMGGGFYDRTFSCKKKTTSKKSGRPPYLIGWAHAFQQVPSLPTQPWDVPLDAVVTEKGFHAFSCDEDTGMGRKKS